jgi:hypothetical protein
MWDFVIAEDFFQQFDQHNLLWRLLYATRARCSSGGSMPANDLGKNFFGRPQNMTAFQEWMGEADTIGSIVSVGPPQQ